jgi:hypothetical protein
MQKDTKKRKNSEQNIQKLKKQISTLKKEKKFLKQRVEILENRLKEELRINLIHKLDKYNIILNKYETKFGTEPFKYQRELLDRCYLKWDKINENLRLIEEEIKDIQKHYKLD